MITPAEHNYITNPNKGFASDLIPSNRTRIELPNTDSICVLYCWDQLSRWIKKHGNLEIEYDKKHNVYRVPAFQKSRENFKKAKLEACKRWGSE